ELRIAAPVAGAAPRYRGPRPLAGAIAQRVDERMDADAENAEGAAPRTRPTCAVAVGLDDRASHLVAEVGRIEPDQEPEPAVGGVHLTPFGSKPPSRAACVSASSRRASAFATRSPS